jgi:hypothetical protein
MNNDLRFANNETTKGWDELCRQAPTNIRIAFETIRANPRPMPPNKRQHRLKHELAWVSTTVRGLSSGSTRSPAVGVSDT